MITVLVVLAEIANGSAAMAQDGERAGQHAERASAFVQRGDLKNAEAELRKAIDLSPNDPALLTSLGGVLGMQGDLKHANVYLAKAVRLRPDDSLLRRNLAANQWQLGQFPEAHENLERLLRADPHDKIAVFLLGMVCENERDYGRSITLLESIPEVIQHQPEALVALASSYNHTGRHNDAVSALNAILGGNIKPQVAFMAGRVAMDAHEFGLAERLFSRAASTYSDPAAINSQLALAQYRQGHPADAEKTLLDAISAKHANGDAYVLLCKLLADRGAYSKGLEYAAEAARVFPDSPQVLSAKGALEMKLQSFSAAADSLRRAAALSPSVETTRDLALAEWRAGNREKARTEFEDTLRRFPRDTETLQTYGTLLIEDGSAEGRTYAIKLFKRAIAIDTSAVEALYNLGNLALADGQPQLAAEYLERAIRTNADDSRLHFALSRAYRRLGRGADADSEMQKYEALKAAKPASAERVSTR